MPHQLSIQIDATNKVGKDWTPALKAVAVEFETIINPALVSLGKEPIPVNSKATQIEGFLGTVNTPPSSSEDWEYDGLVTVHIPNYDFINARFFSMLPQPPSTFWLCSTKPPQSGAII